MNNEKYDDWFNEVFDEAFERAASHSSTPDHDTKRESWLQVKQQLESKSRRKQRRRRFQMAGIIAASMAIGAILFSPPTITQAVSPIYQQIKEWGDGIVTIISGKDDSVTDTVPKTSPPPGRSGEIYENLGEEVLWSSSAEDNNLTLEEVKSRLTFTYSDFEYIPQGYKFHDVLVAPIDEESRIHDMAIQYVSESGKILNISYINIINGPVSVSTLSSPSSESFQLDSGTEALYTEGIASSIQFTHNGVMIRIVGEISKEELLKIANSLP
ncbi:MAG: DUF4367 domain-containing protein [Bacillota bacterium]